MYKTSSIHLPFRASKMNSLHRRVIGGEGTGSVLLDGGIGGQSSYHSIEDSEHTTKSMPQRRPITQGSGLADKIASKLSNLKLEKKSGPKKKNITMSF